MFMVVVLPTFAKPSKSLTFKNLRLSLYFNFLHHAPKMFQSFPAAKKKGGVL